MMDTWWTELPSNCIIDFFNRGGYLEGTWSFWYKGKKYAQIIDITRDCPPRAAWEIVTSNMTESAALVMGFLSEEEKANLTNSESVV